MSNDISTLLKKLNVLSESLDANQRGVGQLPADAKMGDISPVLGSDYKQHPADGKLVGEDADYSGASFHEIKDAIHRRINYRHPEIYDQYPSAVIRDAVADVASFHEGGDLGTSDVSIMVREVLKALEATKQAGQEVTENAEELNIGDDVIITGNVQYKGKTGVIKDFGRDKHFVVVNLYNYGPHSFHSSDVSFNDYADSEEEEEDMYNRDPDARRWAMNQELDEAEVNQAAAEIDQTMQQLKAGKINPGQAATQVTQKAQQLKKPGQPVTTNTIKPVGAVPPASATSAGAVTSTGAVAEDEELNEEIIDTTNHPKHGRIMWMNHGGSHMIARKEPNGSLKIFTMGERPEIARKWAAIKKSIGGTSSAPQTTQAVAETDAGSTTASVLAKLARVVKSVQTPEQFEAAQRFANLVFNKLNAEIKRKKGFGGLADSSKLLRSIDADLKAKARDVGARWNPDSVTFDDNVRASQKLAGVAESSDYARRRQREEDIISGKKPARKKKPAQTSDYAKKREKEKDLGEAVSPRLSSMLKQSIAESYKKVTANDYFNSFAGIGEYTVESIVSELAQHRNIVAEAARIGLDMHAQKSGHADYAAAFKHAIMMAEGYAGWDDPSQEPRRPEPDEDWEYEKRRQEKVDDATPKSTRGFRVYDGTSRKYVGPVFAAQDEAMAFRSKQQDGSKMSIQSVPMPKEPDLGEAIDSGPGKIKAPKVTYGATRSGAGAYEKKPEELADIRAQQQAQKQAARQAQKARDDYYSGRSAPAAKLDLDAVWRKVEDVVGQTYPDGDPIDWLAPWLEKQGIRGLDIGDVLRKAARKNGYKDIYDYYHSFDEEFGGLMAEGLPGSLSKSDYMPGKTVKHSSTNCTTCHGRKVMYKTPDGKLHADNKKGAVKVKCSACNGTGDKTKVSEAKGLNKRVKIVAGPAKGKTGTVGEVRHGQFKGAPKEFTIDLDGGGNIRCMAKELRLIKDEPVAEGKTERDTNAKWAQITDYEQRAKKTKDPIKKDHYAKMASKLRRELPTSDEAVKEDSLSTDKKKVVDFLNDVTAAVKKDSDLVGQKPSLGDKISPVAKTIKTDDGHEIKILGTEDDGFRISIKDKTADSKFSSLDEAIMACEMYCAHRRNNSQSQDYLEEQ